MRKSLLSLIAIAAIIFAASCSKDDSSVSTDGKMGSVTATFTFSQSAGTRASSNAIPVTSWANISSMNLVLYNTTTNTVVYSKVINPALLTVVGNNKTATYTDVPVTPSGQSYTLALIANVQQGTNAVRTFFGTDQQIWSEAYMYSKNVSQFRVDYPTSTKPAGSTATGKTWLGQPAEVFTAYAQNVVVAEGVNTTVPTLNLKRDVSMMRVRLNQIDADAGSDNTDVDFNDASAYIRIDRLSDGMKITSAANVFGAGNPDFAMNAAEGANAFRDASYSLADYSSNNQPNPPVIVGLGDNYDLWNDIIIFPNVDRHENYTATPAANNKYFIVVAGMADAGHKLSDGTTLTNPGVVYWSGIVDGPFINNVIREVNLRLATGGTTTEPTEPPLYGGLEIEVGEPMDWDSNIQSENIDM